MIDVEKTLESSRVNTLTGNYLAKKINYEKTVYAFLLLEFLEELLKGKHYVFKGGTSLLLLFGESSRFSIDVDIEMKEDECSNKEELEKLFKKKLSKYFDQIYLEQYERKHGGRNIECSHFRFFYKPRYETDRSFILLDINYTDIPTNYELIEVKSDLICCGGESKKVKTITIDDLLSEKLAAFAPNTIGIKFETGSVYKKYCEIIKQLHDCAYLVDKISNIDRVYEFYLEVANYQIKAEGNNSLTIKKCLIDTIKTCELILSEGKYGSKTNYNHLLEGVVSFNEYKIGEKVNITDLKIYAAKVLIFTSRLIKRVDPVIKKMPKGDYFAFRSINLRQLPLLIGDECMSQILEFGLLDL